MVSPEKRTPRTVIEADSSSATFVVLKISGIKIYSTVEGRWVSVWIMPTPIPLNLWEERIARYSPEIVGKNRRTTATAIPTAFGKRMARKAAIREPVASPASAVAKDRGISIFLPTIPMLDSMELTEKAAPLSSSLTPAQPIP